MTVRVLIVDDDEALTAMLAEYLGRAEFEVEVAHRISDGLRLGRQQHYAVIVLDVMLPDGSGLDLCRRLRERSGVPILMLTARGDEVDRVIGLEIGADDYVPKPFGPRELLARLRALVRRTGPATAPGASGARRHHGRLTIDTGRREVLVDGEPRPLTTRQFALLSALAAHPGRVLSRDALIEAGGTPGGQGGSEAYDRSIDVQISRIRAAIEDDPGHPRRILTVRGAGYVFAREQS